MKHLIKTRKDKFWIYQNTPLYWYITACGLSKTEGFDGPDITYDTQEVTCKNCKNTHFFNQEYNQPEVIKEMIYNSTIINLEEHGLL